MRQLIIAALLIVGGMAGAGPAPVAAQAPAVDLRPFVARQIAPRVHLLSTAPDYYGPVIGNITLIEQSDGFVVIDSGANAANGRTVVAFARSLASKPIKAVAITHWHNDHPQGVSAIRDAFPSVRIIATTGTEAGMLGPEAFNIGYAPDPKFDEGIGKQLAEAKDNLQKLLDAPDTAPERKDRIRKAIPQYESFAKDFHGSYIVPPTETFERELLLDDRDLPVRLLYLGRANTNGDLLAWLPNEKIVVTGDIVVAPSPFGFFSFPGDWIETIGKLKALGFTTLIPGHGEPMADAAYLDRLVTAIADIRAKVGPLAKQGVPVDQVRAKVDFTAITELWGDSPRNRLNFENLFIVPMIPNAYKEALGQPIVQGEGNPKPDYVHTPPKPSSKKHPT
jgi:glyoxylase-like metal-dependent hydrolase (beta-lactamase superfamily II)